MRTPTAQKFSALAAVAVISVGMTATTATASSTTTTQARYAVPSATAAISSCGLSTLPSQAATTLRLIHSGGPFPYSQDGVVFQNREGILPAKPSSYYPEYTEKTPGSSDRGARRLIGGGALTTPASVYYNGDHYASFCKVNENG
ncbi:MAG: ribonuclease [Kribbellaceae bacterium]|nr:ribonuclease [Kribbellaceae bacterium]